MVGQMVAEKLEYSRIHIQLNALIIGCPGNKGKLVQGGDIVLHLEPVYLADTNSWAFVLAFALLVFLFIPFDCLIKTRQRDERLDFGEIVAAPVAGLTPLINRFRASTDMNHNPNDYYHYNVEKNRKKYHFTAGQISPDSAESEYQRCHKNEDDGRDNINNKRILLLGRFFSEKPFEYPKKNILYCCFFLFSHYIIYKRFVFVRTRKPIGSKPGYFTHNLLKEVQMVKVKWLGHSAFEIRAGETRILIDPFITGNPAATVEANDLSADFILLTHGHGDHVGDAFDIAKRCGATIIAPNELAVHAQGLGLEAHPMHIGGAAGFSFGKVKLTQAFHGSSIVDDDGNILYMGMPCGFLIEIDGKIIYHAGDTGLFGDMELIGQLNPIDLALLPIGDNFTMGPEDAAYAVKLLKPETVIPMHYGTWPVIDTSPDDFAQMVGSSSTEVVILEPGGEYEL